jgi:uncharacterized protein YbdZ (MbtH family)
MNNPFENRNGTYFVLTNAKNQHSIWPSFMDVPPGWKVLYGEANYVPCVEYIDTHWSDMW